MESVRSRLGLLTRWLLPPRIDDEPELRLGAPPLELAYGFRAYAMTRALAATLAVLQHIVMAVVTGDPRWWVVAGLAFVHLTVMIPLGTAAARRAAWAGILVDASSMLIGTLVVGDPIVLVFWAPMLLLSVLVFLGGRTGQIGVLITIVTLLTAFGARQVGFIRGDLPHDALRLHALLSSVSLGAVAWIYLYALGAAVRRKDQVLEAAEAGRVEALRQAAIRGLQLETMFDATPVGLSMQDADTRFVHANQRLCEIVGLDLETILEEGVVSVVSPETLTMVEQQVAAARTEGRPFRIEFPITTAAGERRWVEHSGHTLELEAGVGFVSTLVDMTAERVATARSRRFAAALETTSDLVIMWDSSGRVLHTNRAFQAMWRSEDVTGWALSDVVGSHASTWTAMGDEEVVLPGEFEIELSNGTSMTASILVMRSVDEGALSAPVVYTAAIRDIGEIVEARRQLEGLLTSKDQFIASVSHELRTPLTVVMGMAHELAHHPDDFDPSETKEIVNTISEQSSDLAAMVEDLLTAARAEAGVLTVSIQPIDLGAVVKESVMGLSQDDVSRVEVTLRDGVAALADPVRARQVVRNLLTNARRYGGPNIGIRVSMKGAFGLVEVCDDGDPIPLDVRSHIFEAYGRGHDRVGTPDSVGLGLTVSKRLANLMNGDVSYDHDGAQSIFSFVIPLAPTAASPTPVDVAARSIPA